MDSFASIEGLCNAVEVPAAKEENNIRCVILFDNEEVCSPRLAIVGIALTGQVGSVSHHGAESNLLPSFVERVVGLPEYASIGYHQMLANSYLISADMGHAVSPPSNLCVPRLTRSLTPTTRPSTRPTSRRG